MNLIFFLVLTSLSINVMADSKKKAGPAKHVPSPFQVVALNSPVEGPTANFLVKTPEGFEIDKIKYKIKNAIHLFEKDKLSAPINWIQGPQGKELHIPVSKLPPGFYQLYIKVIDKKKNVHDFKTKYNDYSKFIISETVEVPKPDEKLNNKTLEGIDSDSDGIRDDIQRWINEEYSDKFNVKHALKQMARAQQLELISFSDKAKSIKASVKLLDSNHCLHFIVEFDESVRLHRKLEKLLLNTKERIESEMKTNANFSGQSYLLPEFGEEEKALCDFEPESL